MAGLIDEGLAAYGREDYATAMRALQPLAEVGDVVAQFYVGSMYEDALGVDKDYRKAAFWYRKAADQGHAGAQHNLSFMYSEANQVCPVCKGLGIASERTCSKCKGYGYGREAFTLKALLPRRTAVGPSVPSVIQAEKRKPVRLSLESEMTAAVMNEAQKLISFGWRPFESTPGKLFLVTSTDKTKKVTAQVWSAIYRIKVCGANQRVGSGAQDSQAQAKVQHNLGIMYANGRGVPQDYQKAMSWYRKAADQGLAPAQLNLGNMYANGRGLPTDYQQAKFWYCKAADQGEANAQHNLGVMYVKGRGGPKDYQQAYFWSLLASMNGEIQSAKLRDLIYELLTPKQRAAAQSDAENWKPT